MSSIDYLLIAIIFVLATLLGYFLHKALQAQRVRQLELQLAEQDRLKDALAQAQRDLQKVETEHQALLAKEDQLRQDFYQLTLKYKKLQDEFRAQEEALLNKQYEVPPQLAHIEESNVLLSDEIKRLRRKIRKLKAKNFYKENKTLKDKLRKSKSKMLKIRAKSMHQKKLAKYEELYNHIQALSKEAKILIEKTESAALKEVKKTEAVAPIAEPAIKQDGKKSKKKKKNKDKRSKTSSTQEKDEVTKGELEDNTNIFSKQPEFKKRRIFQELISQDEGSSVVSQSEEKGAFDLDRSAERSLMDLAGMDAKSYAALYDNQVDDFEKLAQLKIADVRSMLSSAGLDPADYPHATWPIQADLAKKDKWEIIQDYRDKMGGDDFDV